MMGYMTCETCPFVYDCDNFCIFDDSPFEDPYDDYYSNKADYDYDTYWDEEY